MKNVEIENVHDCNDNAFNVSEFKNHFFTRPLHFHPEYEIVYIEKGDGYCFAGDGVVSFSPGDLYVFSSNLAHYFLSDKRFYEKDCNEFCKSEFIQFRENILPANYLNMPGTNNIRHLITNSSQGLQWNISNQKESIKLIKKMKTTKGFDRLINLYSLLNKLGDITKEAIVISSKLTYNNQLQSSDIVYKKILEYISSHLREKISLGNISEYAGMNKSALCRYFKNKTGESIFDYIMEFRISFIKRQLANSDNLISDIAYNTGFNNMANFNSQFKKVTGYTPSAYRELFK